MRLSIDLDSTDDLPKRVRRGAGFTQDEIAAKLRVYQTDISRLERNCLPLSSARTVILRQKYAALLGVPVSELFPEVGGADDGPGREAER
jgi:DNA-binding XRE family transcriptional regulator